MDVCREAERELHLAERFDKQETAVLLKSDAFPAIDESIIKRFLNEISENIINVRIIIEAAENRRASAWYSLTDNYVECLYYLTFALPQASKINK